jgi:hypothetical protein
MENRHRVLLGLDAELYRSSASETDGCLALLRRAKRRLRFTPRTLGADKGFFSEAFIEALLAQDVEPHIAVDARHRRRAHARVRMRVRGLGYRLSQRCRKKIEELFGRARTGTGCAASVGEAWRGSARRRT